MSRKILRLTFALALGLALLVVWAPAAQADCYTYQDSRAYFVWGYGGACAGSGATCSECTTFWPGGGGYTTCVQDSNGYAICTDYQY